MGLFTKTNPTPARPAAAPAAPAGAAEAPAVPAAPPGPGTPAPLRPVVMSQQAFVAPQQSERQVYLQKMKLRIHQQLVERLDMQNLKNLPPEVVRGEVRILIRELCQSEKGLIKRADQER